MRTYKKFIILKYSEYDQELMLVRRQPDEKYGGLGLVLYRFGRRMKWPEKCTFSEKYSDDEKDLILKILEYQTSNSFIMRTMPINPDRIVDEDDELYDLISRYIYGNHFA